MHEFHPRSGFCSIIIDRYHFSKAIIFSLHDSLFKSHIYLVTSISTIATKELAVSTIIYFNQVYMFNPIYFRLFNLLEFYNKTSRASFGSKRSIGISRFSNSS
jgi:hypothetical protein